MALMEEYLAEVLAAGSVTPADLAPIRQAARLGEPQAMVQLGVMLGQGVGVQRNPSAATRWFHQAAKAHDLDGQTLFGLALVTGFGIARDEKKGLQWLYRAAQDGHLDALDALSELVVDNPDWIGCHVGMADLFALWTDASKRLESQA